MHWRQGDGRVAGGRVTGVWRAAGHLVQLDEDPPWLCVAVPRALAAPHPTFAAAFHGG